MQELRLVLIIIGALVITALLLHGLWTSRKEKPAKFGEKPLGKIEDTNFELQNIAEEGVGEARVVGKAKSRTEPGFSFGDRPQQDPLLGNTSPTVDTDTETVLPKMSAFGDSKPSDPFVKVEPEVSTAGQQIPHETKVDVDVQVKAVVTDNIAIESETAAQPSSTMQQSVQADKPSVDSAVLTEQPSEAAVQSDTDSLSEPELKSDSIPDMLPEAEVLPEPEPEKELEPEPEPLQPSYLSICVHARKGKILRGPSLFACLERHGLIFGENSVYHRHADLTGTGPVIFSVTNLVNPGSFPETNYQHFETPGIGMYLMLPCNGKASDNFNMMLQTAQQVADELNADVLDHNRVMITPNRITEYREKAAKYN